MLPLLTQRSSNITSLSGIHFPLNIASLPSRKALIPIWGSDEENRIAQAICSLFKPERRSILTALLMHCLASRNAKGDFLAIRLAILVARFITSLSSKRG